MQRLPLLLSALAAASLAASCRTGATEATPRDAIDSSARPTPETRTAQVIELLEDGDVEAAYASLGGVLVDQYGVRAAEAFAAGRPEDGLLFVDRALSLAPEDADTLLMKAEGSLALAEKNIAEGGRAGLIQGSLSDALDYFQRCEPTPEVLLGASRAAILTGDYERAHGWAATACDELAGEPETAALPYVPEELLSEAAFFAYTDAKQNDDERAPELFERAEDALGRLLGRAAGDPLAWGRLADLYEWEERYEDARATLERALDRLPEEASLLERLARVSRKSGGSEEVIAVFASYNTRFPEASLARWYGALERFEAATQQLMARFDEEVEKTDANADLVAAFRAAEEEFQRTRLDEPDYTDACLGYEVMCRNAIGWAHYQDDALEDAEAAFRSMDEVVDRGLEWKIESRLLSGVDGMHLVGTGYNEREDWEGAARAYEFLHRYQPENDVWANNTGFFYRDAAVELELVGKRLCAAAHGDALGAEALQSVGLAADASAEELAARANEYLARARELMQRSWDGYRAAARLAPEDVRVVNDTGLVLVYYLHTDLDEAERLLLRCVEMGARQLEDETLEEDARWELKNAWGDAHQNLGVLHAIHRDDPAEAQRWFERAVEIGPEPRPQLSNFWLPLLRGEVEGDQDYELYSLGDWGEPCTP